MFYIPCVKGEFVFREPAQQKNVDLLTQTCLYERKFEFVEEKCGFTVNPL